MKAFETIFLNLGARHSIDFISKLRHGALELMNFRHIPQSEAILYKYRLFVTTINSADDP